MKTTYSRRELYAMGEPIGESSTYELAGRRVYGGGGGIVGDLVGGVSDALGGAVDAVGDLGQGAIDTVKENPELAAAAAMYFGMPGGFESLGGAGGLTGVDAAMADLAGSAGLGEFAGAGAGITGLGDAAAWDAATAGEYGGELFGGMSPDAAAWDAATSGAYGGPAASSLGFGSQLAKMLGKSITGDPNGLTLGGGLLGAAGIAGLMNMIKEDNKRFGTPGRQDMASPLTQFRYNPASFRATTPNPADFRPAGVPTAKVGYAMGGDVQMDPNLQQVRAFDPVVRMAGGGGISGLMTYARGGNVSTLGGYSDGGRMLKGPGDGMSDSIPASISGKQPARLADGEFVVSADVVSGLGNGSTDAGAKQLYKMMDRVRSARTGRKSQGREINPKKYMPA